MNTIYTINRNRYECFYRHQHSDVDGEATSRSNQMAGRSNDENILRIFCEPIPPSDISINEIRNIRDKYSNECISQNKEK